MPVDVISTVTVAANSYDLTDLTTVKTELGISGSTYDDQLGRYITVASIAAGQYCNRVFVVETVQDRFDITFPRLRFGGEEKLQTSRWPVITMTSLTENGTALVKDTDYKVDTSNGLLIRLDTNGDPTTWGQSPVIATYSVGFASIPADLEDAVIRMIRARWFAKDRDPFTRQENIPGVRDIAYWVPTGTDAGNMTPDVEDILDNYRQPVV
jgi:hypothetical protein